jgi:hypothetical protein
MENPKSEQLFDVITQEAVVSVNMSAGYYRRIQEVTASFVKGKNSEQINGAHDQIRNQAITEDWVKHYETMLILCKEFEAMAKEQGFVKKVNAEELRDLLDPDA